MLVHGGPPQGETGEGEVYNGQGGVACLGRAVLLAGVGTRGTDVETVEHLPGGCFASLSPGIGVVELAVRSLEPACQILLRSKVPRVGL